MDGDSISSHFIVYYEKHEEILKNRILSRREIRIITWVKRLKTGIGKIYFLFTEVFLGEK